MYKINPEKYDKILFCGIGGSAVPGEVVKALNIKKPVLISREIFPESANSKTLCFVISYSGNTAETLKLYGEAKRKKCQIIIITSGGKLEKKNEEMFLVPKGFVPREALVYMLKPVLKVLGINQRELEKIPEKIDKNYAKKIAAKLNNKIPVVYSPSEKLKIISYSWQTLFNENSKVFAHSNYFPELAHNEIEAKINKGFRVVLLFDKKTEQIKKAKKIIKNSIDMKLKGKNPLEKIIYGIYLGNSVSKALAKIKRINYKETKKINMLK